MSEDRVSRSAGMRAPGAPAAAASTLSSSSLDSTLARSVQQQRNALADTGALDASTARHLQQMADMRSRNQFTPVLAKREAIVPALKTGVAHQRQPTPVDTKLAEAATRKITLTFSALRTNTEMLRAGGESKVRLAKIPLGHMEVNDEDDRTFFEELRAGKHNAVLRSLAITVATVNPVNMKVTARGLPSNSKGGAGAAADGSQSGIINVSQFMQKGYGSVEFTRAMSAQTQDMLTFYPHLLGANFDKAYFKHPTQPFYYVAQDSQVADQMVFNGKDLGKLDQFGYYLVPEAEYETAYATAKEYTNKVAPVLDLDKFALEFQPVGVRNGAGNIIPESLTFVSSVGHKQLQDGNFDASGSVELSLLVYSVDKPAASQ